MSTTNFNRGRSHMKSYQELLCSPSLVGEHQKLSNCFAAVDIILSITTFLGNSLIPVALDLPSTRRPNPSIVVWQELTCWLVLLLSLSVLLIGCWWFTNIGVFVITQGMQLTLQEYMWSFFADDGGDKRGQTYRPVVGAEIQRDCNFETHLYHYS